MRLTMGPQKGVRVEGPVNIYVVRRDRRLMVILETDAKIERINKGQTPC